MLNNKIQTRQSKDFVYGAFAEVTKALSSPRRLELLDLLLQGPRPVEGLARAVGQPLANASQHLQVLKRARVVETERRGTTIEYRLAPAVADVFVALRRLAEARNPALPPARERLHGDALETIDRASLQAGLAAGGVTLIDVRPAGEYAHAHLPDALSMPIDELEARIDELPEDALVVATCRGPYCVFAADAVRILRRHGRRAVRFEDGPGEWSADGGTLITGGVK